jgi:hypothetical protein
MALARPLVQWGTSSGVRTDVDVQSDNPRPGRLSLQGRHGTARRPLAACRDEGVGVMLSKGRGGRQKTGWGGEQTGGSAAPLPWSLGVDRGR